MSAICPECEADLHIRYGDGEESFYCPSCRLDKAERLLRNIVDKLREIENYPTYKGIFTIAYAHGLRYDGPTYGEEVDKIEAFLEGI